MHFNGGFGRAAPLTVAEVLSPREGETALVEAEEGLLAEVNALGRASSSRGSRGTSALRPAWRAIGLDAEGLDLAAGGRAARAQFAAPAHDPEAWRARLEHCSRPASGRDQSAPAAKINANKSKEMQGKILAISLDSFGGIGTFQWVTANPNKKSTCSDILQTYADIIPLFPLQPELPDAQVTGRARKR